MTSTSLRDFVRVQGIDRLRAYAALSVLLAHVVGPTLPGYLRYVFTGHPAVIVFFVISGFCIHRPYVEKPLPVFAFYISRILRILPPTLVALFLAQKIGIATYNFSDGFILWSILCELWYYAFYPVLLVASKVIPFRLLAAASAIPWIVIIVACGHDQYGNASAYGPWLNWLVAFPSWLCGCVLAEQKTFPVSRLPIAAWRIIVASVASLLYWATLNSPVGFYLTMNPFALLVVFWIQAEIAVARGRNFWDSVGNWSFSIYLFHVIAWLALSPVIGASKLFLLVPLIVLSCYLAGQIIEKPSHRLARLAFRRLAAFGHINPRILAPISNTDPVR